MRAIPFAILAFTLACSSPTGAPASTADAKTGDQVAQDTAVPAGETAADTASDSLADTLTDTDATTNPDIETTPDAAPDTTSAPDIADNDADASPDATPDIADVPDAAIDIAADATTAVCKDLRTMADNKVPSDACWAPPMHYCSTPYLSYVAFVCKPDFSVCMYGQCRPCGWIGCPMLEPGDPWPAWASQQCPKNYKDWLPGYGGQFAPIAAPYYPDPKATFCWDNAPADWSDEAHHLDDEKVLTK